MESHLVLVLTVLILHLLHHFMKLFLIEKLNPLQLYALY